MSRIDDLPADRRAVLQLLLKQGKSYDDLGSLLRIDPATVRERARDALDLLGPAEAGDLSTADQDEIADYLLGQQPASERAATREMLATSAPGRAWARVVAGELRPLAGEALPDIPAEGAEMEEAFNALQARRVARERQANSSRLGGALLLGAIGVAVAFLIVFVLSGSNDDSGTSTTTASAPSGTTSTTGTSTTPKVLGQVNLNPLKGSPATKAIAALTLVRQGDEVDILFQGQNIPPNGKGDVYALWVVGNSRAARLGFTPRVKPGGKLRFPGALPAAIDLSKYSAIVLTRETQANPKSPGTVILGGSLPKS